MVLEPPSEYHEAVDRRWRMEQRMVDVEMREVRSLFFCTPSSFSLTLFP